MKSIACITICLLGLFLFVSTAAATGNPGSTSQAGKEETGQPEKPAEERVTGSVSAGIFSKYIFRGYELSRNSVVIQPATSVEYKGFSVSFWGNIDTNSRETPSNFPGDHGKTGKKWFNETDLTISYGRKLGIVTLTGGYIYYNTKYTEETEELFLSAGFDVITKPTVSINQDITSYPGTYINLSFSHSFDLYTEKGITLDLGASFGYFIGKGRSWKTYSMVTDDYTGKKYRGFHDGSIKAGFTVPVTKAFVIQPTAQYWFPLSGNAKKKVNGIPYNPGGNVLNNFVWGVSFSYTF